MTFVVCIELAENAGLHNIILQTPDGFLSAIKKHQKMLCNSVSNYTFVINFNNIPISVKKSQRLFMIQPPSGEIVKNFIIREIEFANPHNHSQTLRFPLSIKIWGNRITVFVASVNL